MVLQITLLDGTRMHWICICDGWIYDSNSTNVLQKSILNLDLCAQLYVTGSQKYFVSTGMTYYFLPTIMNFGKTNKLSLTTVLPSQVGFEYTKCDCVTNVLVKKFDGDHLTKEHGNATNVPIELSVYSLNLS